MKNLFALFMLGSVLACGPRVTQTVDNVDLEQRAGELAQRLMLIDTHIDVPYRLTQKWEDISQLTSSGDFDYPRAKSGGLNVVFMSIYVPADTREGEEKDLADKLIDMVEGFATEWPDKFALAASVVDVRSQFAQGKMSLAMGTEGDIEKICSGNLLRVWSEVERVAREHQRAK